MPEPEETVTLRDYIERQFAAHEMTHLALADQIKTIFTAHEKLHESQANASTERFAGHQNEHVAHNAAHAREHQMAQIALDKAEASMDRRLAAMNEFRQALDDASKTMMGRAESLGMHARTSERIDEARQEIQSVRDTLSATAVTLRAERAKDISSATGPLDTRLSVVEAFMIRTGGRDHTLGSVWGWIVGGMGLVGVVAGIVLALLR